MSSDNTEEDLSSEARSRRQLEKENITRNYVGGFRTVTIGFSNISMKEMNDLGEWFLKFNVEDDNDDTKRDV